MKRPSRRQLAELAANRLLAGAALRSLARQLAAELIASGRAKQADLLVKDILAVLQAAGYQSHTVIYSAHHLDTARRGQVAALVKKSRRVKHLTVQWQVDAGLLGGLLIETGGYRWDHSVRQQLSQIKQSLRLD